MASKKDLSERDICTQFILPALRAAGWDIATQVREEVGFTAGRIYVKGKLTTRGKQKRADFILYYRSNIPIAVIEAKDNKHTLGDGMQQGLEYARILDLPSAFSSNGDGFLFHNRTITSGKIEQELALNEFPSPQQLWETYKTYKGIVTDEQERVIAEDYYSDASGRTPRYYQQIAINRTLESIAKGQARILLVMATGTGKTYTSFQIIYRLWKSGTKKRILFLADRTALIDQTARGDFKHFKDAMTIIKRKKIDPAYNIYLALYQGLTDPNGDDAYKKFSRNFFDLIIIDECHRGSAKDDSEWRKILDYFNTATHIGLTATPKETKYVSNIDYFGDPIYTYSLKQGIDDGFLAPYKVVKVTLDVDAQGWRPPKHFKDKDGQLVEDRIYNTQDFDKNIIIDERREIVAKKISAFLKGHGRYSKTIVFCIDIEHAEGMRSAIANENADLVSKNHKYVMRITGDNEEGKRELDNFINPNETYPVIATTSKLMTTGVDAQTCKLIVLDSNIGSMTEFKQIIGRGTRINEEHGKMYFVILDFRNVTNLFADPNFDGTPEMIKETLEEEDISIVDDIEPTEPIIDIEDGSEIVIVNPYPPNIRPGGQVQEGRFRKVRVKGVEVSVMGERVQYLGADGKVITETLRDYTKRNITQEYTTLQSFLAKWNTAEKATAVIEELAAQGILIEALQEEVGKDLDPFDLICHLAYDQPPLTRKERANQVKKRNYFTKYSTVAQQVLQELLEKYAEEGIENVESLKVLKIDPFDKIGSIKEIYLAFGGKLKYIEAIRELKQELYKSA